MLVASIYQSAEMIKETLKSMPGKTKFPGRLRSYYGSYYKWSPVVRSIERGWMSLPVLEFVRKDQESCCLRIW